MMLQMITKKCANLGIGRAPTDQRYDHHCNVKQRSVLDFISFFKANQVIMVCFDVI